MGDQRTTPAAGEIGCRLSYRVEAAATLVLQVTAYRPAPPPRLVAGTADGDDVAVTEIDGSWADGGRQHLVRAPVGDLTISYRATMPPRPAPAAAGSAVSQLERITYTRPSRYCPSDRMAGFATARFAGYRSDADGVRAICDYVHSRTSYTAGASGPGTDAAETLLSGAGVCRDYAHLTVALCRAVDIPARVVAVYAPGLAPMDFHLVAEAAVGDRWYVWDATRLAPRPSMVRIATGRDAADVAFATTLDGVSELTGMSVFAVAPGDLPVDDHEALVTLH
ncbi:transglutaminase family protein [Solwaraspora sp. WMMD792]|uniref:transglutaminase-like domain-containing protein n=1 Tax=Solwaraspora sp. WMMD792 TaxID=3016099 RepID=UPI002416EDB3|nr:transglutaminase family protein [Solwaraspora sp. WMMD792]MDG4770398.1 transglutaminase family protein [Solwaraspora sp. WMMD792]